MTRAELKSLIKDNIGGASTDILTRARGLTDSRFGRRVYTRGLVEISNYCKNDCYYCGIRRSNARALRYRLSARDILERCAMGYSLGFRSFVLQGGEDEYFTERRIVDIISMIKQTCEGAAVTLSLGEKPRETYKAYRAAGADRYLLRHEAACERLYRRLHPDELRLETRKKCLYTLKELGFQVGAGFLVMPPGQGVSELAEDLYFLQELEPHMVGIGPFIPHRDTPFGDEPHDIEAKLKATLTMLALTRIILPKAMLPATTALATLRPQARVLGLNAGANVVMPNLSPPSVRKRYALYNNKLSSGAEAADGLDRLKHQLSEAGFTADMSRGDWTC